MITLFGALQALTFLLVTIFVIGLILPERYFPKAHDPRRKVIRTFGVFAVAAYLITALWSLARFQVMDSQDKEKQDIVLLR